MEQMTAAAASSSAPVLTRPADMSAKSTEPSGTPASLGISVELTDDPDDDARPPLFTFLSAPAAPTYQTPMRQHRRTPSQHREVKETLNAHSEYTNDDQDGRCHYKINQYTIKEEIGRGSYGAVHLATDQFGHEYAVKEFSKARLRKRAQSNILRHGPRRPGRFPPGLGFNRPMSSTRDDAEAKDALYLIREEIAIMKKLNHPNLVQLIEVLDDPEQDSLYMVLEMCKKGVIMKVGLDEPADPYTAEECRCWFRDLILGIEYLHAQGVVHRDIKPDNLLLTDDDVLKVVDFGVSEMFERLDDMRTAKSAGSPAFLPPELCVARHGDVSGKACDIWSMGVSLYCLRYGRIPFERSGVLEIYEAIKTVNITLPEGEDPDFVDLMSRILEKDPDKRITMAELHEHPWVTRRGEDPLLGSEENCANPVEPPNALEVNHAFTRRMSHLLCVMKAISKFKNLLHSRASTPRKETHAATAAVAAPSREDSDKTPRPSMVSGRATTPPEELSDEDKKHAEYAAKLVEERMQFLRKHSSHGEKGHAHDPTDVEPLFLGIGMGGRDDFAQHDPSDEVVSDSPTAVDFNVYDHAYESEIKRIKSQKGRSKMYLTKHIQERDQYRTDASIIEGSSRHEERREGDINPATAVQRSHKFAEIVTQAVQGAKAQHTGS